MFNVDVTRPAPDALEKFVTAPNSDYLGGGTRQSGKPAISDGMIREGERDNTLTSMAGTLRRNGMDEGRIAAILLVLNHELCNPPLSEAQVRKIARSIGGKPSGRETLRMLSVQEMMSLPSTGWLIDGILPSDALIVLCGPPGHFKSFVALDWAMSVAADVTWNGRQVFSRPVVYVVAEGANGYGPRIDAWMNVHQPADVSKKKFIPVPVQLIEPDHLIALINTMRDLECPPGLIVIDTLARCFVGGDENSAKEMGMLVDAAEQIRAATGASVMLVHHTGKKGDLRGSTALPGAAHTIIRAMKTGKSALRLKSLKAKDSVEFPTISMRWRSVEESGVLEIDDKATADQDHIISETHDELLTALAPGPLRHNEWKNSVTLTEGAFKRARAKVIDANLVEKIGKEYHLTPAGHKVTCLAGIE